MYVEMVTYKWLTIDYNKQDFPITPKLKLKDARSGFPA